MVAKHVNLSVTTVIQIFDEHVQMNRNRLSTAICIDEFYFSKKATHKYALLIVNFKNGLVLDVLPSREKRKLSSYFRSIDFTERAIVQYITIDMNCNYRDICYLYFPNAIICIDSFHVMKLINNALDSIRKRVLRKYEKDKKSDEYYLLKHKSHLLYVDIDYQQYESIKHNHHFKYRISSKRQLELMLSYDSELILGWQLKERYHIFNKKSISVNFAKQQLNLSLDTLIQDFFNSNIEDFITVAYTLSEWKVEISNSFLLFDDRRLSNGPIEGRNKYVKIILRLVNGYSNFDRFRNRALFTLNKHSSYCDSKLPNDIPSHIKRG